MADVDGLSPLMMKNLDSQRAVFLFWWYLAELGVFCHLVARVVLTN
jgi:hypothetical protein